MPSLFSRSRRPLAQSIAALAPVVARLWSFARTLGLTLLAGVAWPTVAEAAPKYEAGVLSATQTSSATWQAVAFETPFATPPVVVLGPATVADAQPITTRVRNVTATGFEWQIDEWDYLDGAHPEEKVSYLAVEPGLHQIGSATWQAARVSGVTNTAQTIAFGNTFATTPVVLAQVESTANSQALNVRVRTVTSTNFVLRTQAQEADTSTLTGESVGYIAVTAGAGALDGAPFIAGRSGANVTQAWKSLPFGNTYKSPVFLAQVQSNNGADPFTIRQRNLTNTGVEIFLEEEQSADAEVNHAAEDVGYLALAETQGELRAKLQFGTLNVAQPNAGTWHSVAFGETYANPVVVFGPVAQGGSDPVGVRVRNVTSTGFEWQLDEWDYLDGSHSADTVSYLVAEAGTYTIGQRQWQFGRATGVTQAAATKTFAEPFASTPVVLTQVATTNDGSAVRARLNGINATGFTVRLSEEEAADQNHVAETVHYLAVEPGHGRLLSKPLVFEAGLAGGVTDAFGTLSFARQFADPIFLAEVQTRQEVDPVVVRYRNLGINSAQVRLQEEKSAQAETTHAAESLGYLVFAKSVDLDEDGLPDAWETAHGLNPNQAGDAALDADGDGLSNLSEYLAGTNPQVAETPGTVSIEVLDAAAYELEGTEARVRITRTGGAAPITVGFTLSGSAIKPGLTGADYSVRDAAGATLNGSINLPLGVTSAEVVIRPVADSLNEYPETATVTLSGGSYGLGANTSATVKINDAAPTPENEQLFVAFLTRQGAAQTYASGVATIYLNGPKDAARVSLSFSGLTSNQTNAYLRYGVTSGVGPELRPTLPIGQVVDQPWAVVPVGIYSGQDIVDALYQVGGKYVYLNIGTGSYPAGEIAGTVTRQTGSTTFTPPPAPPVIAPLAGDALTRDVSRFLTQATFGPTASEITALVSAINTTHGGDRLAAYGAWIDQQFALDQTRLLDYTEAADADEWARRGSGPLNFTNNDEPRHHNRRRGWWLLATRAHDQLRQRVAFALSEIFVVSDQLTEVRNRHYGLANYYDQLGARADGNYRALLEDVSKSPVMAKYLSHLQNQKAVVDSQTGQVLISPDENYAREILQLFSIGLVARHPDGTLKLGSDGRPIQTYTNADITELARVFTGWSFSKKHGAKASGYPVQDNTNFLQGAGPAYFQASWMNPLKNFAAYHDTAAKSVLGSNIAAGLNGQQDLAAALDIIFNHPNAAPFISRLLIQRLVTSNPSAGYVHRVSQKFANDGNGVRGNLKAVVRAILLDYEARSLDVVNNVGYGKQKEPIVRYVQLLRAAGGYSGIPLSTLSGYGYPAGQLNNFPTGTTLYRYGVTDAALGQTPQGSPTVFNWFLPDFNPGGAIAAAGLVGPELEITTETSVISSANYHYQLTHIDNGQNTAPLIGATDAVEDNVRLDRTPFEQIYDQEITLGKTPAQATAVVLNHLDVLLLGGNLRAKYETAPTPNPRSIILANVGGLGVATPTRIKELLYLVVTSPEFLHQK